MRFFVHLLWRHLRQYPGRALAALVVLAVAALLMLTLAGAGAALRFRVGAYLAQLFPEERLWLEAGRMSLGPIALEGRPITDQTIEAVTRRPEVARLWPIESIRFPVYAEGNLFGQEIRSEAVIHGAPRELIADALAPDQPWGLPAKPDGEVPIVVSRYFLDLYNLGLARSSGLPLLSPASVLGRHLTVVLNASAVIAPSVGQNSRAVRAVVVGITAQPAIIGLVMPDGVVHGFNKEYLPNAPAQFVKLGVQLNKGADRDAFIRSISELGLVLPTADTIGEKIKNAVRMASWILLGLAASVFALGMLTFYQLFAMTFHSRRLDLIRLRALGLSPVQVVGLALGEVGVIAAAAVVLAGGANGLLTWWLAGRLGDLLQSIGGLPAGLLAPAPGLLAAFSLLLLLLTLLPALPMLAWVVRVEPAQVIRDL